MTGLQVLEGLVKENETVERLASTAMEREIENRIGSENHEVRANHLKTRLLLKYLRVDVLGLNGNDLRV